MKCAAQKKRVKEVGKCTYSKVVDMRFGYIIVSIYER